MHTPSPHTSHPVSHSATTMISDTDEDPGGFQPPLIMRSTGDVEVDPSHTTGLLARRRKRSARRAGRHG